MNIKMQWSRFTALIISFSIFLMVPFVTAAEPFDPSKDLQHDVRILEAMMMYDLSQYQIPTVRVLSEANFDAYMAKMAKEAGVPEQKFLGYQPCESEPDVVLISSAYARVAGTLQPPMDSQKHFRLIRIHELYHWANCKISGPNRFYGSRELWSHEEGRAFGIERRFLREQLGTVAALFGEYMLPAKPDQMPKGALPEEILRDLPWKLINEDGDLIMWETASGSAIFVNIASSMLAESALRFPDYDTPGQHIPSVPDTALVFHYYQAIMHLGKYVGFEKFELIGENLKDALKSGVRERKEAWWDRGYVPVMKDGKGFAPDNPVYTGEWVRIDGDANGTK